ncbi:hypothetical protein VDP73_02110 [Xanthomonas campestris pv. campestris]|nr:hypothetical protein [Xanthomonas campestris]MDO0828639.1 hypothetical protein [Xanthomonas campestris pv. campestris]MEA0864575.1 hypothetical protein [Xanthomonas campestris pv. campestris]MEB1061315.1 hypothetical protein [Xanthomonas campestris pv. campestris]MEB1176012.1 hypothetical protein [Xanthomonas campestris pv. campestris]MEB1230540.1 hypothetical protein [Xanthomonas campestris pv. campestris]
MDKYKLSGYSKITAALASLVVNDGANGIKTKIVLVDSLVPKGGVAAIKARNAGKFKSAVDRIYTREGAPEYLILLGGPDVIPHIPLRSPWGKMPPFGEEGVIESDLPYASDKAHTLDPSKFQNASRMVGRIPDVPGDTDPSYLVDRINEVVAAPTIDAVQNFCLSADIWKGASNEVAKRLFGAGAIVHCSPVLGPVWRSKTLKKPIHYINCHGDTRKDTFYGEKAGIHGPLPHAINAGALVNNVMQGTVVVAECCYGAELFEPSLPHEPLGMALSYLAQGATTFLGSSTVSYGGLEAVDLACADEMCLFFLEGILKGDSCGAALVYARRRLLEGQVVLDNYQIKTLAQFMLLGDPARHPVKLASKQAPRVKKSKVLAVRSVAAAPPLPKSPRNARPLPVASKAIQAGPVSAMPAIPMPKGVAYTAKLYAVQGRHADGRSAKSFSIKGKSMVSFDLPPCILVVSIPNEPQVIAEMRTAWEPVAAEDPAMRNMVHEAAVLQDVPDVAVELAVREAVKMTSQSALPRFSNQFLDKGALRLRPRVYKKLSSIRTRGAGSKSPERNSDVVFVARIANGQIQSYKVLVAR